MLIVAELADNGFDAEKSARGSWMFVVTEVIVSGIQCSSVIIQYSGTSKISQMEGAPTPEFWSKIFAKNCMKMREIGQRGGAHPLAPPPLFGPASEHKCQMLDVKHF